MGYFHTVKTTRKTIKSQIRGYDDYSRYWSAKQNIKKVKDPRKKKYFRFIINKYQKEMLEGVEITRPAGEQSSPSRS